MKSVRYWSARPEDGPGMTLVPHCILVGLSLSCAAMTAWSRGWSQNEADQQAGGLVSVRCHVTESLSPHSVCLLAVVEEESFHG